MSAQPITQAEPDWFNADTCIENMQCAYDDALEADPFDDGNPIPIDTVVDAGDLGVLIGLARYAVSHHTTSVAQAYEAAASPTLGDAIELPIAQVRHWYTQAYGLWLSSLPEKDDAEDEPTPRLLLEMGEVLAAIRAKASQPSVPEASQEGEA